MRCLTPWILVAAFLIPTGCGIGAYRPEPLDGSIFTATMAATRAAIMGDDLDSWIQLFPKEYNAVTLEGNWTALQRLKREYGDRRMDGILTPPDLGTVTLDAALSDFTLDLWFDYPEGLGRRKSCYQTVWTFRRGEESDEWRLGNLTIHHPTFHYDDLHGDLVRLSRSQLLSLDLDWESAVDPEPLWRRTREAILLGDADALHRCSVAGTVAAAGDRRIDLPNIATLDADGDSNRRSTRKFTESQIKELKRFCRELRTTPDTLAPLFRFFPLEAVPPQCRMLRMKLKYRGRGLEFGTHSVTVSWTGFRPHDRWLTEGMWIEYAEVVGL
jgi:hypothetical protein